MKGPMLFKGVLSELLRVCLTTLRICLCSAFPCFTPGSIQQLSRLTVAKHCHQHTHIPHTKLPAFLQHVSPFLTSFIFLLLFALLGNPSHPFMTGKFLSLVAQQNRLSAVTPSAALAPRGTHSSLGTSQTSTCHRQLLLGWCTGASSRCYPWFSSVLAD